jgi:hypothetical protein
VSAPYTGYSTDPGVKNTYAGEIFIRVQLYLDFEFMGPGRLSSSNEIRYRKDTGQYLLVVNSIC